MHNKKIILLISLFLTISSLFASPIVVEGYGSTYEEATNDSLLQLSSYISTEVSSVTTSTLEVDKNDVDTDTFSQDLVLSSFSKLMGVQYNKKADVDGLKCVEAIIPDNEVVQNQYITRISDIINEMNKTNTLLKDSIIDSDKLQYLEYIFNYLKEYNNYKFIMIHLNQSWIAPSVEISETSLKVEYLNILDKQQKLLDSEIANLESTLSEIEQKQSDKLNQIIDRRNKINAEREKTLAQEQKWREGVIQSKTAEIIAKAEALKAKSNEALDINVANLIPNEDPLIVVNQVESKINSYETTSTKLLNEIKDLRLQTEDSFLADKEKINNRKLSTAEKSMGKETEQSKNHTLYLIEQSKKSFFEQYKENRETLIEAVEDELDDEYEIIQDNIESLNKSNFVLDSFSDDINITIGQYNGSINAWPVVLDFTVLDKRIEMEFNLSYENFTQTKIPQLNSNGQYSKEFSDYLEQVEVLEAYLADPKSNPISVKLQYSISSDEESLHNYIININKLIVIRNDNNERIIKANLSPTSIDSFQYTANDKITLYSIKEKLALQEKQLVEENQTIFPEWNVEPYVIEINHLTTVKYYFCDKNNNFKLPNPEHEILEGYYFNCWYSTQVDKGVLANQKIKATQYLIFKAYYSTNPELFKYEGDTITGFVSKNSDSKVLLPYFSPTNVTIKKISDNAFRDAEMEILILSDGIEEIGELAFYNCLNLKTFIFGDGMKTVNRNIFSSSSDYVKTIENLILPRYLEKIEDYTFWRFSNLKNVVIPESLVEIGEKAFRETSIVKLNLPDSLEKIGDYAFADCYKLEEINFPSNLKTIGNYAFYNTKLNKVELSDNVVSIEKSAFENCTYLNTLKLSENLKIIGGEAFRNTNINEVIIPNKVEEIGEFAFYNCPNLKTFVFGDGMKTVNRNIFSSSSDYVKTIENLILPRYLEKIEDYTFWRFSNLKNVVIPESLVEIGEKAFRETSIVKLNLPDSLEKIGDYAFADCYKLEEINFPSNLKTIGNYAFYNTKLNKVELSDNVVSIEKSAFENCKYLTFLKLSENLQTIGSSAFEYCTNLTTIKFPENLQTIGSSAFKYCTNLTTIKLPENLQTIGSSAFEECTNLTTIKFPENLQTIGDNAFSYTAITSSKIPKGVTVGSQSY
jgi:hypothetical protein